MEREVNWFPTGHAGIKRDWRIVLCFAVVPPRAFRTHQISLRKSSMPIPMRVPVPVRSNWGGQWLAIPADAQLLQTRALLDSFSRGPASGSPPPLLWPSYTHQVYRRVVACCTTRRQSFVWLLVGGEVTGISAVIRVTFRDPWTQLSYDAETLYTFTLIRDATPTSTGRNSLRASWFHWGHWGTALCEHWCLIW